MKKTIARELKEVQKERALEIRRLKSHRPLKNREGYELWKLEFDVRTLARLYRIDHIVYSLLRGRTLDQIEQPREENRLSEHTIQTIYDTVKSYKERMVADELTTLCSLS